MRTCLPPVVVLALGLGTAWPGRGYAAEGIGADSAAVVAVEVTGASDAAGELTAAVRDALGERMRLASSQRVSATMAAAPGPCSDAACRQRVAGALGVRWLVRASVATIGSDYDIEVSLIDGRSGMGLPAIRDRCTLCGWAEVGVRLGALARAAASLVTVAPIDEGTLAGRTLLAGGAQGQGPARRTRAVSVAKWVTGAGALGMLAASAVLLGIHGRTTCSLPADAPAGLKCAETYDTAIAGAVLLGAGTLAGIASGTLFYVDYARDRAAARESFTVGIRGRF